MRITPLASGSQGNSLLVEAGGFRLLVDAGLEHAELEARLTAAGVRPSTIDAMFVTHRHHDHVRAVVALSRAHRVPVWGSRRTVAALGSEVHRRARRVVALRPFELGPMRAYAVPVEHDAPETMALVVEHGGRRFGHVTDLGSVGPELAQWLEHCDALALEFNHDAELLRTGDDPPHLKRRVASPRGHLSNEQAGSLLRSIAGPRLRALILLHLSQRNNRRDLALAAAREALAGAAGAGIAVDADVALRIAEQDRVSEPIELAEAV